MMAKTAFPMKTGGALGKTVALLIALAILALVIKHPAESADTVTGLFRAVGAVIDGIGAFLQELSK
jgi:hypothetical protein